MSGSNQEWLDLAAETEVPEGDLIEARAGDRVLALYKINGQLHATDGLCTHEQARLCDGLVSGEVVECPRHNARFHIPSGKVLRRPAKIDLLVHEVRVENGRVLVKIK
jgi:nitrite reductase/ring-hydroxylating ferredoxin subunit